MGLKLIIPPKWFNFIPNGWWRVLVSSSAYMYMGGPGCRLRGNQPKSWAQALRCQFPKRAPMVWIAWGDLCFPPGAWKRSEMMRQHTALLRSQQEKLETGWGVWNVHCSPWLSSCDLKSWSLVGTRYSKKRQKLCSRCDGMVACTGYPKKQKPCSRCDGMVACITVTLGSDFRRKALSVLEGVQSL